MRSTSSVWFTSAYKQASPGEKKKVDDVCYGRPLILTGTLVMTSPVGEIGVCLHILQTPVMLMPFPIALIQDKVLSSTSKEKAASALQAVTNCCWFSFTCLVGLGTCCILCLLSSINSIMLFR